MLFCFSVMFVFGFLPAPRAPPRYVEIPKGFFGCFLSVCVYVFFTVYGKNLSIFIGGKDVSTVYFVGDVVVVW